jgi:flagellar FliL protein
MSAAAAPTVNAGAAVPAKKGKKKLIIIAVAVLLVLLIAGGGAALFLKKRAADQAAENGEETSAPAESHASAKPDLKHPPTFLPLDPFVVNLADKDADRYAQVGITFEVEDAKFADQMKQFMPAIRNGILMILAHKGSRELMDRAGKEQLAGEIQRDAARTMGIAVDEPEAAAVEKKTDDDAADDEDPKPKAKPKAKKSAGEANPIRHVHFSNFIVQ